MHCNHEPPQPLWLQGSFGRMNKMREKKFLCFFNKCDNAGCLYKKPALDLLFPSRNATPCSNNAHHYRHVSSMISSLYHSPLPFPFLSFFILFPFPFLEVNMGIDIKHNKLRKVKKTSTNSDDPYTRLLVKLYRFLARRTDSKFNAVVLRRLMMARSKKQPLSVSKIARQMANSPGTAVVVGTVTDDVRMLETPKLSLCALHVTAGARARILKAGGEIITFDQLALRCPTGKGTVLLQGTHGSVVPSLCSCAPSCKQSLCPPAPFPPPPSGGKTYEIPFYFLPYTGPRKSREAQKHFTGGKLGAPGTPGGGVKPFVRSKGRKFEKARGRRSSRGFRN